MSICESAPTCPGYGPEHKSHIEREHIAREILGPVKVRTRGVPEAVDGSYAFRIPVRSGKDRSLRGKARRKARRGLT